jgi:hypothetical protein
VTNGRVGMEDTEDSDILLMGCAYTPLYGEDQTTLFKHGDMTDAFAKSIKDLPVYIEHDTTRAIGKVRDAFINEKRQLMTLLHISGDPLANKLLPPTLYKDPDNDNKGFYNALSLGNSVGFKITDHGTYKTKEVQGNVPSEVSLVMAGNRPMTEIDDYWFVPKNADIDDYIKETINPFIVRHH